VVVGGTDPEIVCTLIRLAPPDLYRIEQAVDGFEVCQMLRWFDVALVVVEVGLIKGDAKLRRCLERRIRLGVPVVVTAREHSPVDEVLARQLGCVLYAPMPVGFGLMHQAVTDLLCVPAGRRVT